MFFREINFMKNFVKLISRKNIMDWPCISSGRLIYLQDHLFWIMHPTKYLVGCVIQKGACLQFVQRSKKISPGYVFGDFFKWVSLGSNPLPQISKCCIIICIITQFCVTIFYVFYTYCVPP